MSQVWLITGSSRGLGRSMAEAVLAAGHRLVATARNRALLDDLVEQYGDQVRAVALDVTDLEAARQAVQTASNAFGCLDVLVNNAGYANVASIEDVTDEDFREQVETNFFGVVNLTRAALPLLRTQRSGHVIQISSIGGRLGSPGLSAYQSSKWAVEGFSEVLARETSSLGIKVTIVEPGGLRTDWAGSSMKVAAIRPEYQATVGSFDEHRKRHIGKQGGDPARAAQAILQIANVDDPPLRLLLGSDAFHLAGQITERRVAEDAKWKDLTLSTDFPGTPDQAKRLAELRLVSK
jgi:NAD(P)-dependent dehydrogenase (short-subunit alcohol dehydrogenase family)